METKLPAPRALAAIDVPPPVLPDKPLRVTEKVRRAINLFVAGDCKLTTEAAEKVGLARESLGRALDRPHVIAYLQQRTRKRLEILAARAGAVKGELAARADAELSGAEQLGRDCRPAAQGLIEQAALARPCVGADRPAKRSAMLGVSRERPTLTELLPRYGIMACWNTKGLARSASKTVWRKFIGRHPPPLSDDERLSPSPAIP